MIPVYITNLDLLPSVQAQIRFFRQVPDAYIVLIDNASTYPGILNWLAAIRNATGSRQINHGATRLSRKTELWEFTDPVVNTELGLPDLLIVNEWNQGNRFFCSIRDLMAEVPQQWRFDYYYSSDADLDYTGCSPEKIFRDLIAGLERYQHVKACAVTLRLDDLPDTDIANRARELQAGFHKTHPKLPYPLENSVPGFDLDPEWFVGACDTAGIMRPIKRDWGGSYDGFLSTEHIVQHLPWYHVPERWECPQCQALINPDGKSGVQLYQEGCEFFSTSDPLLTGDLSDLISCSHCRTAQLIPPDFAHYYQHMKGDRHLSGLAYTSHILDKGLS